MGRKSLKKDRGYITKTEWATEFGGYKAKNHIPFRQLPFFCCAITFTPFEVPACTLDGTVYDLLNILPYIKKFHRHPVTGEPLAIKDIVRLNFHKNADGEFHCPVLNKVFTAHTHIVAIRPTGNVYCWEAVEELNIKMRNLKDLLTDEPFTRKDIIHLQDPLNLQGKNVENFHHVKHELSLEDEEEQARQRADPMHNVRSEGLSQDAKRILSSLHTADAAKTFKEGGGGKRAEAERMFAEATAAARAAKRAAEGGNDAEAPAEKKPKGPDPRLQPPKQEDRRALFKPGAATWNTDDPDQAAPWVRAKMEREIEAGSWRGKAKEDPAAATGDARPVPKPYMSAQYTVDEMHTTGAAARSFTSSATAPVTVNERKRVRVERKPKKKGYLRLHTSLGDLNLELHCDIAPRTCENFFVLAESGYYAGTPFHRSIRNFMIQGGDPTGTGTGGESIYGPTFKDEVDSRLTHNGRGVLSMANSGPGTNGSQFFVLYKSAHHLDFKHSVFGRVVGGMETLTAMERVQTDDDDRPLQEITITGCTVYVNPYKDEEEAERKAAEEERKKAEAEAGALKEAPGSWYSNPSAADRSQHGGSSGGVGKYLAAKPAAKAPAAKAAELKEVEPAAPGKKRKAAGGYGSFDAW